MIVPVTSAQNNLIQSPNPKSENNNSNSTSPNIGFHSPTHIPNLCDEPTSVLDLQRSPSPVAGGKPGKVVVSGVSDVVLSHHHQPTTTTATTTTTTTNETLGWVDEQGWHNLDWDSIMREWGLHDDSAPPFKTTSCSSSVNSSSLAPHLNHPSDLPIPHFSELISPPQSFDPTHLVHSATDFNLSELCSNQSFSHGHHHHHNLNLFDVSPEFHHVGNINNNWNVGFDFIEDLIRVADCFDSDDLQLAQVILERLNQRLRSSPAGKPVGRPLQRAALYFKEALQSLLSGSNRTAAAARLSSWSEIVQTIRAYKAFSTISPIPMFSHFTTNQALLEALGGSNLIHVIDFDIGLGGQYASLMKELAEKAEALRVNPPVLRVTAVVQEEYAVESRLIRENLSQFAQDLKIRFHVDFVLVRTFEVLSFKAIKFVEGEKTAVLLSTASFRRHVSSSASAAGFLGDVRRISPAVVVFVDAEGWGEGAAPMTSFRRSFVCGLEFYSMVMESLDAAIVGGGGGGDWVRKIEALVLRPRIQAAVEAAGRRTAPFREMFHGAGMRPVPLSQFADFQAQCLLAKVQVRGFDVARRQSELVLCWHERALVATSVWKC